MRRQKRFKKIELPFKRIVGLTGIFLFFIISSLLVKTFLHRSDYFRLNAVEVKDLSTGKSHGSFFNVDLMRLYKDKNIFDIDIKRIAKSLEAAYPDAKDIVARRALPDKLVIDLRTRKPIAIIGDTRYYPVDEEGYLLLNVEAESSKGLPVITGVDTRDRERHARKAGPFESVNLKTALALLKEMRRSKFQPEYGVETIDAGDIYNMTFYLKNYALEVRIGNENFKERLNTLKRTLKDPRLIADKVKYIDLRFKDVVIGPR